MIGIAPPKRKAKEPVARKRDESRFTHFPWGFLLAAAVPVGLAAYYLTQVAPGLVPLPEGAKVPFPDLTATLEVIIGWSGQNPEWVFGIGGALLAAGCLFRVAIARYYAVLAVAASVALGLTWYSISAPVDRLIRSVEDNLPRDSRVPGSERR
jgi:hypothetical protein